MIFQTARSLGCMGQSAAMLSILLEDQLVRKPPNK